jgi:hypothetical protein
VPTEAADALPERLKHLAHTLDGHFLGYGGIAGMRWMAQEALWAPQ